MQALRNFTSLIPFSCALLALGLIFGLNPELAEGRIFQNAYVSFELSDRWECKPEQTEWVCRIKDPGLAEAIIILTAKEVGPQDAFPIYEGHLKTPRTIVSRSGQSIQSTIYQVQQRKISNHPWIDGMHFSSEVYNYFTRYLATIKERLAVLVTFSAHKLHYTKYSSDFFQAIESLRVTASKSVINGSGFGSGGSGGSLFGGNTEGLFPNEPGGGFDGLGGGGDTMQMLFALLLIGGGIGAYLYLKKRKKKR